MRDRAVLLGARSSHARRYLLPNERLVAEVRWHPVWLARRAVVPLAVTVVATWLAAVLPADNLLLGVAAIALLASGAWFLWQVAEWWNERLVITDRRVMLVRGLITRRIAVLPLRKVTDMTYERPLFGRLFAVYGWGTFVMESAGQDQALHRVPFLPHPDEVYMRLLREIFGDRGLYGSGTPGRAAAPGRAGTTGPAAAAPTAPGRPAGPRTGVPGPGGPGGRGEAAIHGPLRSPGVTPHAGPALGGARATADDSTPTGDASAEDPTLVIRLREESDD